VEATGVEYGEVKTKMKFCRITIFLILFCVGRAHAAVPTFAGNHVSGSSTQGNTVSSYALRLPNLTQTGNCIIVAFQYSVSAGIAATVSDDMGNTYSTPISNSDARQVVNLSLALNVAAGTQKITIAFSGGIPAYVTGMASEFYNVATSNAIDGSSGQSSTGTAVSAGSITPTTAGDLIYQYAVEDSSSGSVTSWTQGSSPWTLLSADILDGTVAQYQVQPSTTSINPTLTMAPSQNFNSVAIALKSASAGNAPPGGIRVLRVQHNSISANAPNPLRLQFPCTGNLIVVAWIGEPGHDITAIADGNGNSYAATGAAFEFGLSGDNQIYYAANATTSTMMTGPNLTTIGSEVAGSNAVLFDVADAATTTSPFDSTTGLVTASGDQTGSGPVTAVSIVPSTANGLVITSIAVDSNTIDGVSPGNFLSAVPSPVVTDNPVDQNNGWALAYNTNTSAETFVWGTVGGAVSNWASIAVAFKAASGVGVSGSFSGTVSPSSATINTGGSLTFNVQISSVNNFQGQVSLSCPNAPTGISCQFAPTPVQLNPGGTGSSTLTVSVAAQSNAFNLSSPRFYSRSAYPHPAFRVIVEFLALFLILASHRNRSRKVLRYGLAPVTATSLLLILALRLASCGGGASGTGTGGGGTGGTPTTVEVPVQGVSGNETVNLGTVTITVP
jgi:hypothetical protein